MPPTDRKEPGRKWAVFLAVLVHLIFVAVLVFGVSWQTREAGPVMAELWPSLPAPAQKVTPKREPEPKPEPKSEPKPEPKPAPKPEPKPEPKIEQPKPPKVDIELKSKEKEKKLKEEQKKIEDEKRKQAELKRQEQEKLKQERLKQDEVMRQQQEVAQAVARQQASARQREVDGYRRKISDKVKRFINNQPCQSLNNPVVEFDVTLMPTGQLLMDPRIRKSSGNATCDQAIEKAILLAQPLPLPAADTGLFSAFRELHLELRPND